MMILTCPCPLPVYLSCVHYTFVCVQYSGMGYFTVGIVSFFDWHSHIETSATGGAACRKNTTVQDERIESTVLGVSVSEQLKGC